MVVLPIDPLCAVSGCFLTFLRPLDVRRFCFSFSLAAEAPPLKRARVEIEGMTDAPLFFNTSPASGGPGTSKTIKEIDAPAWKEYNELRAFLKGKSAVAQKEVCAGVMNKVDPLRYRLLSKPQKLILKYCAKRLTVADCMGGALIADHREEWAHIVAKLKRKYSKYSSAKRKFYAIPRSIRARSYGKYPIFRGDVSAYRSSYRAYRQRKYPRARPRGSSYGPYRWGPRFWAWNPRRR